MKFNDTHKFFMIFIGCLVGGYIIAHPIAYIIGSVEMYWDDRPAAWTK